MDGGAEPENVGVPQERATLAGEGKVVNVALAWLDWALRDVCWSVGPPCSDLPNTMPTIHQEKKQKKTFIFDFFYYSFN